MGRFRAIEHEGDKSLVTVLLLEIGGLKQITIFNNSLSSLEEIFAVSNTLLNEASAFFSVVVANMLS